MSTRRSTTVPISIEETGPMRVDSTAVGFVSVRYIEESRLYGGGSRNVYASHRLSPGDARLLAKALNEHADKAERGLT